MQMRWASVRIHFWLALRFLKKINEMTWFIVHCFERRGSWNEVYMFWICLSARKSSLTTRLFPSARRVKFPGLEPGLSAQRAMGLPQTNCSTYLFLANWCKCLQLNNFTHLLSVSSHCSPMRLLIVMIEKEGAHARDNTAAVNRKREWLICGFFRDSHSHRLFLVPSYNRLLWLKVWNRLLNLTQISGP